MTSENQWKIFARSVRKETLQMIYRAKASHVGGALSMVDVLTVLYNGILKIDPKDSRWDERDRFC